MSTEQEEGQQQGSALRLREENKAFKADAMGILRPGNLAEAMRLAALLAESNFVPKDFVGKAGNILAAVMMGSEVGLAPLQALQGIAVINGRPSLWGDAMLAVCRANPEWGGMDETGDATQAKCVVTRMERIAGRITPKVYTGEFTIQEAQAAGLLDKPSPWKTYPKRMLKMRARAFALRDAFADALKGMSSADEMADVAQAIDVEWQEMPATLPEAPAHPKRGAEGLREKVQAKAAPVAAPAAAAPTTSKTPSTPPPGAFSPKVQTFLYKFEHVTDQTDLDELRMDLDKPENWPSMTTAEKSAIGNAGKAAWERIAAASAGQG